MKIKPFIPLFLIATIFFSCSCTGNKITSTQEPTTQNPSATIYQTFTPTITATNEPTPTITTTSTPDYLSGLSNLGQIFFLGDDGLSMYLINADGTQLQSTSIIGWLWSPNGDYYIKFEYLKYLNIYDLDGLLQGEIRGDLTELAWSPSSEAIAGVAVNNIIIMNKDGTNARQITNNDSRISNCFNLVWSRDGRKIAYQCYSSIKPEFSGLYILYPNDGHQLFFNLKDGLYSMTWSYDSQALFFNDYNNIYRLFLDNQVIKVIKNIQPYYSLEMSPDGRWIAFDWTFEGYTKIFLLNTENYEISQVTSDKANDYSPSWSPDSRYIVFSSDGGRDGLYIVRLADKVIFQLNEFGKSPLWFKVPIPMNH